MASNKGLREAKAGKNDEFYAQLTDIANEMQLEKARVIDPFGHA